MKLLLVLLFCITLSNADIKTKKWRKSDYPEPEPFPTTPEEDELYEKIRDNDLKSGSFDFNEKTIKYHSQVYFEGPRRAYLTTINIDSYGGTGRDFSVKRAYIKAYRRCLERMNGTDL